MENITSIRRWPLPAALLALLLATSSATAAPVQNVAALFRQLPAQPTREGLFETVARAYRLQPDRRVLAAVGAIDAFYLGAATPAAQAVANFDGKVWQITYGAERVGSLPELADFAQQLQLLTQWAQARQKRAGVTLDNAPLPAKAQTEIAALLRAYKSVASARAADQLGQLWRQGQHHAAMLPLACRALSQLLMQSYDRLEVAGADAAQTLAVLAIARGVGTLDVGRDEALIAAQLGYSAHALKVADALSGPDDGVRAYVLQQDEQLRKIASRIDASIEVRYLYLLRLSERNEYEAWRQWRMARLPSASQELGVAKTSLLQAWVGERDAAQVIPEWVNAALDQVANPALEAPTDDAAAPPRFKRGAPLRNYAQEVAQIEQRLGALSTRYTGPFLPARAYADYFRGFVYAGLYLNGLFFIDERDDAGQAASYLQSLGQSADPRYRKFVAWYAALAQSSAGRMNDEAMLRAVADTADLSGTAAQRLLFEQRKYASYGAPNYLAALRYAVASFDWRPSYRREMIDYTRDALLDAPAGLALAESAVAVDPLGSQSWRVWLGREKKDVGILRAVAGDLQCHLAIRARALNALADIKALSSAELMRSYRALIAAHPDDAGLVQMSADQFIRQKDYVAARAIALPWIEHHARSSGLTLTSIKELVARSYRLEGKLRDARQLAVALADSQKGTALGEAQAIYEAQGDWSRATATAWSGYRRYPDSMMSRMSLARALWHEQQLDAVTGVLADDAHPMTDFDWRQQVGATFVEAFKQRSDAQAMAAYASLVRSAIPRFGLVQLAMAVGESGRHGLAVAMLDALKFPPDWQADNDILQYEYRRRSEGEGAATAWLKARLKGKRPDLLSVQLYSMEEYAFLWSDAPAQGNDTDVAGIWLQRASAARLTADQAHLQQAREFFKQHPTGHYQTIGRYLTGLASEAEVLKLMRNPKSVCEVSYQLGVVAQASGDLPLAARWYHVAVETLSTHDGEYRWAYDQLNAWREYGMKPNVHRDRGTTIGKS